MRRADHLFRGVIPSVVCLNVFDIETSTMMEPIGPSWGCCITEKKNISLRLTIINVEF